VKQTSEADSRLSPPPPLEANDQLVTGTITAGWAIALIVLLIFRDSLRPDDRWWIWTCVTGLALGGFGFWYLPRLKRSRTRSAESGGLDQSAADQPAADLSAADQPGADQPGADQPGADQSVPRDNGSNTVSSTETPGSSTKS
jgi:hypothetical protein